MTKALRTPDSAFENLPGWDFTPQYIDDLPGFERLRVHYVDEGPKDAERVFLCLHGQPSWSYLYRHMIPVFTASGARVIAPDWLGFGRSDKPVEDEFYHFTMHRDMIIALINRLDIKNITLVVQDWGGLIGLTLPMDMPDRIDRLLVMNTVLATGISAGPGFDAWRAYSAAHPDMDVARVMAKSSPILSEAEAAAYSAPYPDVTYKAGVRRFPKMVMTDPDMEGVDISRRAVDFFKSDWTGSSFFATGLDDPVIGAKGMNWLASVIKGAPKPKEYEGVGHFVQEWGGQIARDALEYWKEG